MNIYYTRHCDGFDNLMEVQGNNNCLQQGKWSRTKLEEHNIDVIMRAMASQIPSLTRMFTQRGDGGGGGGVGGGGGGGGGGPRWAQMASNAESVSIWWLHHGKKQKPKCWYLECSCWAWHSHYCKIHIVVLYRKCGTPDNAWQIRYFLVYVSPAVYFIVFITFHIEFHNS